MSVASQSRQKNYVRNKTSSFAVKSDSMPILPTTSLILLEDVDEHCDDEAMTSLSQTNLITEGTFRITISFQRIRLKTSSPIQQDLCLNFFYSPLGIVQYPVSCVYIASPITAQNFPKFCNVDCVPIWTKIINSNQIKECLQDPFLKTELRYLRDYANDDGFGPYLGFVQLPIADILLEIQMPNPGCSGEMIAEADLIKPESNQILGHIKYSVKLEKLHDDEDADQLCQILGQTRQVLCGTVDDTRSDKLISNQFNSTATIENEIERLVNERLDLLVSQSYTQNDKIINLIDRKIELLACYFQN